MRADSSVNNDSVLALTSDAGYKHSYAYAATYVTRAGYDVTRRGSNLASTTPRRDNTGLSSFWMSTNPFHGSSLHVDYDHDTLSTPSILPQPRKVASSSGISTY